MSATRRALAIAAVMAPIAAAALAEPLPDGTLPGPLPAGRYTLDPSHTSLLVKVSHLGFSAYTARFTAVDATLELDPERPADASLVASVDPRSITTHYPFDDLDFDAYLAGPEWLDAAAFPEITFTSTAVELVDEHSALVTGDLTLKGITRPIVLETTFNGGYAGHVFDPHARIGFSATGHLSRSDFGIEMGLPLAGSTIGVGDTVEIVIETELLKPHDPPPTGGG
jgi:polyisoprenoid-binding protein YceI